MPEPYINVILGTYSCGFVYAYAMSYIAAKDGTEPPHWIGHIVFLFIALLWPIWFSIYLSFYAAIVCADLLKKQT